MRSLTLFIINLIGPINMFTFIVIIPKRILVKTRTKQSLHIAKGDITLLVIKVLLFGLWKILLYELKLKILGTKKVSYLSKSDRFLFSCDN
jgi:hypothetical protein